MRLLRDPLLHFVLLGAALFLAYAGANRLFSTKTEKKIEITESEIDLIYVNFERQWGRPPVEKELRALVDGRVREEVLYREAQAMGLDQNDLVVRRRMVQKMEFLSQDLALMTEPTDEALRAFFDEHREDYRVPPRISFRHVFFNADERGPKVEEDARRALDRLRLEDIPTAAFADLGDRFMLEREYERRSPEEIARLFGTRFAEAIVELEPGWHGPVLSGYGFHLVHIEDVIESRVPEFGEIRDRLVSAYNRQRRDLANEALYHGLLESYEVEIDEEAVKRSALSVGKSAARADPR